jgi:hypothetical protein
MTRGGSLWLRCAYSFSFSAFRAASSQQSWTLASSRAEIPWNPLPAPCVPRPWATIKLRHHGEVIGKPARCVMAVTT